MNYTKESCPVCSKQFSDSDDIAVCPVCGTPHHRECYVRNGHCVNEDRHSQGFEWKPADEPHLPEIEHIGSTQSSGETVICPYCGTKNPVEEPVCTSCGARLYNNMNNAGTPPFAADPNVIQIQPGDIISGHTAAETAEFVQSNADRYIPKFYKIERTGKKITFNWAAFFFSPYWFFYRKMYVTGFLIMLAMLTVSTLCSTNAAVTALSQYNEALNAFYTGTVTQAQLTDMGMKILTMPEFIISSCFVFLVHLFGGLFGNLIYKNKVVKDINWAKETAASDEQYRILLFKRGGVTVFMLILSLVGYYCAENIIAHFIGGGI